MRTAQTLHAHARVLATLLLVLVAPQVGAQSITITDPAEWADSIPKPLVVRPGESILVRGLVYHPAGIQGVLVNGVEADTTSTGLPTTYRFQIILKAEQLRGGVTISIIPKDAQRFDKRYAVQTAAPANPPARANPDTTGAAPPSTTRFPVNSTERGSSGGRRIAFAALALAGVGVAQLSTSSSSEVCRAFPGGGTDCFDRTTKKKSYQAVGYGLAGVAGGLLLLDVLRGSHGASALDGLPGPVRWSARLLLGAGTPRLSAGANHVSISVMGLRFR